MQIRFRELIGKKVLGADGQKVGRVAEVAVQRQGEQLEVYALRVGAAALWRRIAFRQGHDNLDEILWSQIERIEKDIHLRVTAQAAREAVNEEIKTRTKPAKRREPPT